MHVPYSVHCKLYSVHTHAIVLYRLVIYKSERSLSLSFFKKIRELTEIAIFEPSAPLCVFFV